MVWHLGTALRGAATLALPAYEPSETTLAKAVDTRAFSGTGQIRQLGWRDFSTTRVWVPGIGTLCFESYGEIAKSKAMSDDPDRTIS